MGKFFCLIMLFVSLVACSGKQSAEKNDQQTEVQASASASADSLYSFVEQQVTLGARNPGSEGHEACRHLIVDKLKSFGADTILIHEAPVTFYTGKKLIAQNILARYNPEKDRKVLLLAHYDTRPWADQEHSVDGRKKPVIGANDGASGVAVLFEIARQLSMVELKNIGVDLLFVDAEDSGQTDSWGQAEETWCLGTQAWTKEMPYQAGKLPAYGILLDMVGGRNANFHREYISHQKAPAIVDKVWAIAAASGYGERFVNTVGSSIIDDHLYINEAGIPCIDIIENLNPVTGSFNPTWHTLSDNMSEIDRNTLKVVTQVVLNTLFAEDDQARH